MSELAGTYCGIVENVSDPAKLGRVKVRVPHVYGVSAAGGGSIGVNDLPWALPAGMPAGGSKNSGGFSHLPDIGDHVYVRFLDGEPEKPIWEWGMQTLTDAKALHLHQYTMVGNVVGKPKRAGWTRWGHTIELNDGGVIATTSQGYRVTLTDGGDDEFDGIVQVTTPRGAMVELADDTNSLTIYAVEDMYLNVGDTITAQARAIDFRIVDSATVDVGTSLTVTALSDIQLNFATLLMNTGTEPFVRGTQLVAFLNSLLLWLTSHTHGNGNLGSPTTMPVIPPLIAVKPLTALLVSETIFGE